MSKMRRRAVWTIGVLLVAGVGLYANRDAVVLNVLGFVVKQSVAVGPAQEIVWSSGVDPSGRSREERPPNIVLILADDLGWNDLTFAGGGVAAGTVPTPHIDSIAAHGVNFRNGYAANATCAPSRAAILSGRYGTRFGFEFTPTPPGMMRLAAMTPNDSRLREMITYPDVETFDYTRMGMPSSEITIAELLGERGYHNVHIGKWHVGMSDGMAPRDQGFDESLLMASGLYLPEDHPEVVNSKQAFDPIDRFLWAVMSFSASFDGRKTHFEPDRYLTDYYTHNAVQVIEANRDRPFFLYLAHWAPHTPLQATRADYDALSHIEDHRERVYGAMIRALDRGVGEVLQALKDNGLEDNTLVIFTSDNGGAGYLGLPRVNHPFRGWKISLFEGGIHVPFFMKWPQQIAPGTVYENPVHHFDLFATAAAAAGAALPDDRVIDGMDLLPFVRGEGNEAPHRALFWRSGASQSALVDGWKLNVSDPPGRHWLFNLRADPNEQQDLSATRPDKLAQLQAALAEHNAQQSEPAWPTQASVPINIDKDLSQPDAPDDEYIYWSN